MSSEETVSDLVAEAALDLAETYGDGYENWKFHVCVFLGIPDEEKLYHIRIKNEASAASTSIRHVVRNGKKVTAVDVVHALTTIGGLSVVGGDPLKFWLAATNAGLFFFKALKKAFTIELQPADAALLWALKRLGNHVERNELQREWKRVIDESQVFDADTSENKFRGRLAALEKLGCIFQADGRVSFAELVLNDENGVPAE